MASLPISSSYVKSFLTSTGSASASMSLTSAPLIRIAGCTPWSFLLAFVWSYVAYSVGTYSTDDRNESVSFSISSDQLLTSSSSCVQYWTSPWMSPSFVSCAKVNINSTFVVPCSNPMLMRRIHSPVRSRHHRRHLSGNSVQIAELGCLRVVGNKHVHQVHCSQLMADGILALAKLYFSP